MHAKSMAAIATLVAASGVIAGVWLMGPASSGAAAEPSDAASPPGSTDGSEIIAPAPDLFALPAEPGPARVFFEVARDQPMPAGARRRMQGWMAMINQLIERMDAFDLNGDGKLGDLEKAAMGMQLRAELLAEHDLDGDGEMSREEWDTYRKSQFEQSLQGQLLMRRFDADGDGLLSETEQAAMDAHLEQQRREQELDQMDSNGDGEISESERRAARQREDRFWQSQSHAAESNFDYDGDGELNIEESRDAWDAFVEYQTVDDFVTRYDADGDRRMGPADYDRFLSDYGRDDPNADVNSDGEINVEDINAFRDLVLRSRRD